jgi:hypothetical protein
MTGEPVLRVNKKNSCISDSEADYGRRRDRWSPAKTLALPIIS